MKAALSTQSADTPVFSPDPQIAAPVRPLYQPAVAGSVSSMQVQALVHECWRDGGQPKAMLLSWAAAGLDWEDIYLLGVVPAAQALGTLWLADRMDFVTVTIASTRLQQALYDLSPTFLSQANDANNGLSALLFCSPGSQHSMGVFMLAEFFRKNGWRVNGVPFLGSASALRCVQADWFDVVGLSVSSNHCLQTVGGLIRELRAKSANPELKIMVGGPMVAINRGLMLSLGADFIGGDARESQRLASQYVRKDPRGKAEYQACDTTMDSFGRMPQLTNVNPVTAKS